MAAHGQESTPLKQEHQKERQGHWEEPGYPSSLKLACGESGATLLPISTVDCCSGDAGAKQGPIEWVCSLRARLPSSLLGSISVSHHVLKGIVAGGGDEGLIGKPVEFLLGAQHVSADRLQSLAILGTFSPWVLKPLIGLLSDNVPIFGFKRNPIIVLVTVLACIAVGNLGTGFVSTTHVILVCTFLASLQIATCTLIVDAKRSEVTKVRGDLGLDLVTYTEVGTNCGNICSAMLVGPLITCGGPRTPYLVALPFVMAPFVLVLGNWLQDERLAPSERPPSLHGLRKNPTLFSLGLVFVPLLSAMALGSALGLPRQTLALIAGAAHVIVIGGYYVFIRPEISGPVVLYVAMHCLSLQINGAFYYFLTDPETAYPEGPHFSPFFYASVMGSAAIFGRMLAFATAKSLFANWQYLRVLQLTVPLMALTQLALVPMLLRWNLTVGISDKIWILGWTFTEQVTRGWRTFPFSVMVLQATPLGLEASSFALNTGATNMGLMLGVFFGGYALSLLQVQPGGHPGESAAFRGLWKAQMASALLPLLMLPLMPLILPRRKHNERLILDNPESATHGAPAEMLMLRWT